MDRGDFQGVLETFSNKGWRSGAYLLDTMDPPPAVQRRLALRLVGERRWAAATAAIWPDQDGQHAERAALQRHLLCDLAAHLLRESPSEPLQALLTKGRSFAKGALPRAEASALRAALEPDLKRYRGSHLAAALKLHRALELDPEVLADRLDAINQDPLFEGAWVRRLFRKRLGLTLPEQMTEAEFERLNRLLRHRRDRALREQGAELIWYLTELEREDFVHFLIAENLWHAAALLACENNSQAAAATTRAFIRDNIERMLDHADTNQPDKAQALRKVWRSMQRPGGELGRATVDPGWVFQRHSSQLAVSRIEDRMRVAMEAALHSDPAHAVAENSAYVASAISMGTAGASAVRYQQELTRQRRALLEQLSILPALQPPSDTSGG